MYRRGLGFGAQDLGLGSQGQEAGHRCTQEHLFAEGLGVVLGCRCARVWEGRVQGLWVQGLGTWMEGWVGHTCAHARCGWGEDVWVHGRGCGMCECGVFKVDSLAYFLVSTSLSMHY